MFVLSETFTVDMVTPTYVRNYIKNNNVGYQTLNLPKRTVRELGYNVETVIDEFGAHVPVSLENSHVGYVMIVEDTGEEHVMHLGGEGGSGISVRDIDWASVLSNNVVTEHYRIVANSSSQQDNQWSGDGKIFVVSSHTSQSAGWVYVYEYDEATDAWGKFDTS